MYIYIYIYAKGTNKAALVRNLLKQKWHHQVEGSDEMPTSAHPCPALIDLFCKTIT